jgi:ribosomal protein S18 acetylase RimI-like enzyme
MPRMDNHELLDLVDRQLRRDYPGDGPEDLVERDGGVIRHIGAGDSWCGVIWSDLDEDGADAAITAQLRYFGDTGRAFEWKLYAHDRPADLGERLARAGLVPDEPETLMVAEVAGLPQEPVLPEGLRIEPVTDLAGVERMITTHRAAFGHEAPRLEQFLRQQVTQNPDGFTALVVLAGDEPVCAGRMEFHEGTAFASIWGGGTAPEWRGRGVYRATVAYRARLAAARGYRYLQVDASEDSRPILARLGFRPLTRVTAYNYEP